jgi:hypothetical protein
MTKRATRSIRALREAYEALSRVRLSKNFILRDFLFSIDSASLRLTNYPEHPELVIAAGRALCEQLLEPILQRFGRFAITFGYQSREGVEADDPTLSHTASCPHCWDRQTWGNDVYARVDILPFCVEDGETSKQEFAEWIMHNLDVDLLMQWTRSNVFCLTISPRPRRVWLEWGDSSLGQRRQTRFMGAHYWQRIYPHLPEAERPKFGPSCTGGSIRWR